MSIRSRGPSTVQRSPVRASIPEGAPPRAVQLKRELRGMGYAEQVAALTPPPTNARGDAEQAPVQRKATGAAVQMEEGDWWDNAVGAVSGAASAVGGAVSGAASAVGGAVAGAAAGVGEYFGGGGSEQASGGEQAGGEQAGGEQAGGGESWWDKAKETASGIVAGFEGLLGGGEKDDEDGGEKEDEEKDEDDEGSDWITDWVLEKAKEYVDAGDTEELEKLAGYAQNAGVSKGVIDQIWEWLKNLFSSKSSIKDFTSASDGLTKKAKELYGKGAGIKKLVESASAMGSAMQSYEHGLDKGPAEGAVATAASANAIAASIGNYAASVNGVAGAFTDEAGKLTSLKLGDAIKKAQEGIETMDTIIKAADLVLKCSKAPLVINIRDYESCKKWANGVGDAFTSASGVIKGIHLPIGGEYYAGLTAGVAGVIKSFISTMDRRIAELNGAASGYEKQGSTSGGVIPEGRSVNPQTGELVPEE